MIILGIASFLGLYWTLRNWNLFSGLVTLGLIGGIILVFLKLNNTIGLIVFLISAIIALLYALSYGKFNFEKRLVLTFIILPVMLYWFFFLSHFPGAEWLWFGLFLPFAALLFGITRAVNLKYEWGFVIILLFEAFTHIYPKFLFS